MELQFFICKHCGKIITVVKDSKVPVMCCGQKMEQLIPGVTDAATEKHVPVYAVEGNVVNVKVGEVAHPMTEAHLIEWVAVLTNQGCQCKYLSPDVAPEVSFALCNGETVTAVYAYCNLHGLWKG
ncbi:MAG: desulfoferrodoxin family protein [Oscillospiraceae bacterium]